MTEDSVSANSNLLGDSSTHYLGDNAPCCRQPLPELGDGPVSNSNSGEEVVPLLSQYHSINRE